jgi:hypothetical protein
MVTLPDGSIGLSMAAAEVIFPDSCPYASRLTQEGLLDINYVTYSGNYYWIKASYMPALPALIFDVTAYGYGPLPTDQPQ